MRNAFYKKGLRFGALFLTLVFAFLSALGQVNLQTGSATFSLPMFSWQDNRSSLNTSIGLSYNSGNGLKVSDVASEVGTGWSLVAGGVITRMQVGEPDDQMKAGSETDEGDVAKYPAGYLYATRKAYEGCPTALTKYPLYKAKNRRYKQYNAVTEDKQLDYFAFQFNGKAGMFVLNAAPINYTDQTQEDIGQSLGDSKLKIKFQRNLNLGVNEIRSTITSFTIQDVDGLIYKFSKHGLSKLLETQYCNRDGGYEQRQPDFKKGKVYYQNDFEVPPSRIPRPFVINSWYLTEIKDPLTGRIVVLNYEGINYINATAGTSFTYNKQGHYSTISYKRSISQTPRLTSIAYPDGHSVQLNYGVLRIDFNGAYPLASVDVKYNGRYISKYLLKTTYFIKSRYGTPITEEQKSVARLCLSSVQKLGVDLKADSPPYLFDYFTGTGVGDDYVPPPFYWKKDIWGYYNGYNSKNTHGISDLPSTIRGLKNDDVIGLCYLRETNVNNEYTVDKYNIKAGYAKNGLLRQIIYPTGGTLSYDYQQNSGNVGGQLRSVGGVHVKATSSTDGGYSNGCNNPIVTYYNYVLDQTGNPSSLWGLEDPKHKISMQSFYEPFEKKYQFPIVSGSLFGKCVYKYMYPGILTIEQATDISLFMKLMETLSPVLGIAGSVSTVLNAIKVFTTASGALAIITLVIDVIVGIYTLFSSCFGNHTRSANTDIYYDIDLNSINPLPTQFKRVEVVENPGTVGKTIHEFTSSQQYPLWVMDSPSLSSEQRFAPWAYGLPLKTIVKDKDNKTIKETEYAYKDAYAKKLINDYSADWDPNASGLRSKLIGCKCEVKKTSSQKSTDFNDASQYNSTANYRTTSEQGVMEVRMHGYYTGRMLLINQIERNFDENLSTIALETITEFTYNEGANFEIALVETKRSNGEFIRKEYFYPFQEDANNIAIASLIENNIITIPTRIVTSIKKVTATFNSPYILSDNKTEFVRLPNGAIKPSKLLEKRFTQPVQNAFTVPYTVVKSFKYNEANGDLLRVTDESGRVVNNYYDYDGKYVTATVVNANTPANAASDFTSSKVAYTSFETEEAGGWVLGTNATYTNNLKVTGARGCQLGQTNTNLTATGLDQSVVYRLTFWATSTVTVNGGLNAVNASPTINGFTYYEYELPLGISNVSLSGSVVLDEVRLYPKRARMSTTSFDPLIGKTSECDANNRITYYEYDELGRMRFIKDEKGNIIKMLEYNNVSKQNGCPGVYSNKFIDEIFRRNNCGPGFIGAEYHYTIPAGKYSSNVSQEDADAKAETELLSQGQAAANLNGLCVALYCNDALTVTVYREDCPPGQKGAPYTYTVPAGRYCDTISKDSSNKLALEEVEANAQSYANELGGCVVNYDPEWEADDSAPTQCMWENGQAYIFIWATDINPNSSSYGAHSWKNTGQPGNCPQNNCTNCTNLWQRCANNVCENAQKVCISSSYDAAVGMFLNSYYYAWSNGDRTPTYTDYDFCDCSSVSCN